MNKCYQSLLKYKTTHHIKKNEYDSVTLFSSLHCKIPISHALRYFCRAQYSSVVHQWNFPFEPYPITASKSNLNKNEINLIKTVKKILNERRLKFDFSNLLLPSQKIPWIKFEATKNL